MERQWTEDMGEISGFGGSYEGACRVMVLAGLDWLDGHDGEAPDFSQYENITGFINEENNAAAKLVAHMVDAAEEYGKKTGAGGVTGAMVQFTVNHVMFAHRNGWDHYCEIRRKAAKVRS